MIEQRPVDVVIQKPVFDNEVKGRKVMPTLRIDDPRRDIRGYHKTNLAETFRKEKEKILVASLNPIKYSDHSFNSTAQ